jgi:uncharacterized membrane protein YphA (DoxX/SURF4 family)
LQQPYSKYPGGWPGFALWLLRAAVGSTLLVQSAICLSQQPDMRAAAIASCILAIVGGGALVVGFLTSIACGLAVLGGVGITLLVPASGSLNLFSANPLTFDLLVMCLVSGLLGPGALSLDAHLFGRRKVVIPRSSHSGISGTSNLGILANSRDSHVGRTSPSKQGSSATRPPLS